MAVFGLASFAIASDVAGTAFNGDREQSAGRNRLGLVCRLEFIRPVALVARDENGSGQGRCHDKEGKFKLSKEYWRTESATSAAKRRRNGSSRPAPDTSER